jgi:hypothetical protein
MECFHKGRRIEINVFSGEDGSWHGHYKVWPTTEGTGEPKLIAAAGLHAQTEAEARGQAFNRIREMIDSNTL